MMIYCVIVMFSVFVIHQSLSSYVFSLSICMSFFIIGFNIIYLVSSECAVDEAIRLVAWIRVVSSIHILFSWIM